MKKTVKIVISAFIVLLVAVLGFMLYRGESVSAKYRRNLEYSYKSSLGTLSEELRNLSRSLKKSLYASTASGRQKVCDSLISCSESAKSAASALPFSAENADRIESLLSKCSDYAMYLSRNNARGTGFTEDDAKALTSLGEYTEKLNETVTEIREKLSGGTEIGKAETLFQSAEKAELPDNLSVADFSKEMEGFPEMIYDGPFSDSIKKAESKLLRDEAEISREEAQKIAEDFSGESLNYDSTSSRGTTVYRFKNGNTGVDVSKKGGMVVWMKKSGDIGESKMNYEDALIIAKDELSGSGLESMRETGFVINDNICTISFVPEENGILLYPDLVKISIELEEGGAVEYDASGYIMNHAERDELTPAISGEEALSEISPALEAQELRLAIIPSSGTTEILCYEIICTAGKESFIIYINASTALEEEIFELIENDNSRMTY